MPLPLAQSYQENIGKHPWRDTAFLAGTAGLGAYLAAPLALSAGSRLAGAGSPAVQRSVDEYLAEGGGAQTARKRIALVAAAVGAIYGLYKHSDYTGGLARIKESMSDPDYWKNNPDRVSEVTKPSPGQLAGIDGTVDPYEEEMRILRLPEKLAAETTDYFRTNIYVPDALAAISKDPTLLIPNQIKVQNLIQSSSNQDYTSGFNLTNSAIRSGAHFGAAYLFGQGVGKILSMPSPLRDRVSLIGGLTAAVLSSGILRQV
jgi:hypothetical protein